MPSPFSRYRPLIADWDAFQAAIQRPLPTTIWSNPLKTTPERLAECLTVAGIEHEPLPGIGGGFRLPPDAMPGLRWEYLAGLFHVQEEVSMLPVMLLDLQPTDRVLDMCAAPGNKTAQIGVMLRNRGTVVANDRSGGRMRAARQTFNRLGLVNVTMLTHDAVNLPPAMGMFDKILADVPCTGEGTCRKDPSVSRRVAMKNIRKLASVQMAILRKAVQLCRPGGRIVYSTCTFAPEENELVVDAILRQFGPDVVRIVPATLPGYVTSPGITTWSGQNLHESLPGTLRLWPHQNDTGGFYIAVLEKVNSNHALTPVIGTQYEELRQREPWVTMIAERFGMPVALFDAYDVLQWSKRGAYLVNKDHQPPVKPKPDAIGMFFVRSDSKFPKMTTAVSMLLGSHATQNVIDLRSEQVKAYLTRQTFAVTDEQVRPCTGSGYVLLRYQEIILGVGIYRTNAGTVESTFPKGWSRPNIQV